MMLRHDPTSLPATKQTAARRPDMTTVSAAQITPERIMQFTFGFAPPLIIEAAIRLRVFDVLDEGAKTIEKLCAETQTTLRADTRERRFFCQGAARISWGVFPADERADAIGMGKALRHCPQRATGETYQSRAGRRAILPAIR